MSNQDISVIRSVHEWHEFHKRSRTPFFSSIFLGGTGVQRDLVPFDNRVKYFGSFCDHVAISQREKEILTEKALGYFKKEPEYLLRLMRHAYTEHEEAIERWKACSGDDLLREFESYIHDLLSFRIYVTLPLFTEEYLESYIQEQFLNKFADKGNAWFQVAVTPLKVGSVLEEEIARLQLTPTNIGEHVAKFSWMANVGLYERYYDIAHYQKLIAHEADQKTRLDFLTSSHKEHEERFQELSALLVDDSYLLTLVHTANEAVFFRSYRTEIFYSSTSYIQPLLKKVSNQLGLSDHRDLVWLYHAEIVSALHRGEKADIELISKRKAGYVFLSDYDGAYYSWEGDSAKTAFGAYQMLNTSDFKDQTLKGSGTGKGIITGKVFIIHNASEINKMSEGGILVTHATNIDFVPALKKAIAMVTEEGGILSHAAIISRELGIPGVIGTKIATKVLKDGDLVEVDAEKGIVRILEKF